MPDKILTHLIRHLHVGDWSPARISEQWVDGFSINAERINTKRKMKIPDMTRYQSNLVGPSVKRYKEMVNPAFISKSGHGAQEIINSHAANLSRSYQKYQQKTDAAYETVDGIPAKRFKEAVARSKENYAAGMAKRTLPFTGTRAEGLGVAPLLCLWLTNASIVEGLLTGADELLAGHPLMLTKPSRSPSLKAALNQRLIQAGSTIDKSAYDQAVIKAQNDETNEVVQGFVDPGLNLYPFTTGGKSHIDFVNEEAKGFYLEVLVTRK